MTTLLPCQSIIENLTTAIVVMDSSFKKELAKRTDTPIVNLDISDVYRYLR